MSGIKNSLDMECKSDNFNIFIRNVLDKYHGCYGDELIEFAGEGENEIEFIGKYESLIEDLITCIKVCGRKF